MSNQEIVGIFFIVGFFVAVIVGTTSIISLQKYTEDTPAKIRWETYTKIAVAIIIVILTIHGVIR
jgi:energy-converting hydrogenase Eha subunit A